MGNINCCSTGYEQKKFIQHCMDASSEQYQVFLKDYISSPPQNEDYINGQWKDNAEKTGKGIIFSNNNFYYEGDIVNSKAHGEGLIIWPSGNKYQGQIKNNQGNGKGQLFFTEENISIKGVWKDGQPCKGQRFQYNPSSQKPSLITINDIVEDIHTTQSTIFIVKIEFHDGSVYEGEIKHKKNNSFKLQGQGKITFSDKSIYQGSFYDGNMHGIGRYQWPNGHYFQGQYKKNYRDGPGTYYIAKKEFKKGIWKNGQLQTESTND